MAPPNLATQLVARGHQTNVVPFDNRRRSATGETHPRGIVVRLPLPAGSRALESRTDSGGDLLSPIDCIVVSLLFLSTLAVPGLVWALVSF
jgi:hypothetical protein